MTHFVSRLEIGIGAEATKTPQLDVDYVAALDRRHASLVCRAYTAISLCCLDREGDGGDLCTSAGESSSRPRGSAKGGASESASMRLRMLGDGGAASLGQLSRAELDAKIRAAGDVFEGAVLSVVCVLFLFYTIL